MPRMRDVTCQMMAWHVTGPGMWFSLVATTVGGSCHIPIRGRGRGLELKLQPPKKGQKLFMGFTYPTAARGGRCFSPSWVVATFAIQD